VISSTVAAVSALLACSVVLAVSLLLEVSPVSDVPEQEARVARSTKWISITALKAFVPIIPLPITDALLPVAGTVPPTVLQGIKGSENTSTITATSPTSSSTCQKIPSNKRTWRANKAKK
jgi:hypothetical protein